MLTLATVAFMFITWFHLKKCNFPIRNLANHIPFAFVFYLSAWTFHLHCQILWALLTSFKRMAIFCKLIHLTPNKSTWNDIIFSHVYSYGHMEKNKCVLFFLNFWCVSQIGHDRNTRSYSNSSNFYEQLAWVFPPESRHLHIQSWGK